MDAADSASTPAAIRQLGEFVLRERVASGGQGEIYRAEQPALGRDAIVKILRLPERGADELRARFLREAQIASRLDHPYAAHVYAFGADGDTLWIAMEFVRGTSMGDFLATAGPMPLHRFVPLFDRLAQVVHSAHEQGIVHRDIKPANVMMVSRAGRLLPKLLDLGVARLSDVPLIDRPGALLAGGAAAGPATQEVTGQGDSHLGTPQYMAPEQWVDPRRADARSDVYALGVLCFEMLTGRRPFDGASLIEVARGHAHGAVPPLGDGLPAALDQVIARALAKQPADRFASPLELAAALRAAAAIEVDEDEELPGLPAELRELTVTLAAGPLAEAVALIEAARTPRQLCAAIAGAARTAIRYLGALALAGRAQAGPGQAGDPPAALPLLARLRAESLDDRAWLELARALVAPFSGYPEVHPVPPLVALLGAGRSGDEAPLDGLVAAGEEAAAAAEGDRERRERAEAALPRLARGLSALSPLHDYRLAVRRGDRIELWVGARRGSRRTSAARPDAPAAGAFLLDGEGRACLRLHPLVQALPPTPGAPDELFLLDGSGRFGARLTAAPQPFERFDDELWPALEEAVPPLCAGARRQAASETPPYRGLAPFSAADADSFVGREREVEAFGNRLRTQGLIAVVGPSGAGKSSFVQAGVLPGLPPRWRAVVMRPGADPVAALLSRLRRAGLAPDGARRDTPGAELAAALRRAADARGETLVLVVDQFEEVFTLCGDPDERDRFVAALVAASEPDAGAVRVLLTLRDDFLLRAQSLAPLRDRLARGLELLATPGHDDLVRILIEPARRRGYEFEDDRLPAEMAAAVESLPGALPLLSFTASKLWELRDRRLRRLTRRAHDGLGGVGGALGKHAEATLAALPDRHRALVREAFRHLVTSAGTRAVVARDDLRQILGDDADEVLERLIGARLLIAYEGQDGAEQVEIIHEALLTSWPRLAGWRSEDAEHTRMREQLRAAARQWHERGRPSGLLWRGDALAEYRAWRARHPVRLTELEDEFAAASAAVERRARLVRRLAFAAALAASLASTVVFAGLRRRAQASAEEARARVIALHEEQGRQELLAGRPARAAAYLSAAYSAGGDRGAVRFLLARALAGLRNERAVLRHGEGLVKTVALAPGGERIATGGEDGRVAIWRPDGARTAEIAAHQGEVLALALSPDGGALVSGGRDGLAIAWDPASGRELARLDAGAPVRELAWHPAGAWVAVAAAEGAIALWQPATGRVAAHLALGDERATWMAVAPGGALLAAGLESGALRLWRAATGEPAGELRGHQGPIRAGAFSADGALLVTASDDQTAAVWELPAGALRARLLGHAGAVVSAGVDPTGALVVTGSRDGTARVWQIARPDRARVLAGHSSYVQFAAFAGAGRVVTAGLDGSVRLWDATTGGALSLIHTHAGEIWTAALSGDGALLATAGMDGTGRLFALEGGTLERTWRPPAGSPAIASADLSPGGAIAAALGPAVHLTSAAPPGPAARLTSAASAGAALVHGAPVRSIRFSPDGEALVTASEDGTARIARLDGAPLSTLRAGEPLFRALPAPRGDRVLTLASPDKAPGPPRLWRRDGGEQCRLQGHREPVWSAAFSSDGERIATGADDATARLWRASDCAPLGAFELSAPVNAVAFSPDGALWTGLESGELVLIDPDSGRERARVEGHGEILTAMALSPDGRRIASGAYDGTLSIWDARSGALLHTVRAHPRPVVDLGFTADGEGVFTAAAGAVRLWRLDLEARSPAEAARLTACRMPFVLENGAVVASRPCPPTRQAGAGRHAER